MVPRYSSVAAGPAKRRAGAGHYLWYTHKGVDARLRNAVEASSSGSSPPAPSRMRVETPKKIVTGHGIDLAHFATERGARAAARSSCRSGA